VAAAALGISDERLIVFAPAPNRADVLARLRLADIYLDSFPFSGATSLLDPLEVGLPSIVMDGTPFRSLVGPALLRSIQLEELVAPSVEGYVDLASRLAAEPGLRQRLRDQILNAMRAVPAFLDSKRYGDQLGRMLIAVWQERQAGVASGVPSFVIKTSV
jgi:predicted O-linked N-acetylglucosamine transferase (SPINDLY family)